MPWSAVAGAVVSSMLAPDSSGGGTASSGAASAADPFASQRAQYQTQLSSMMQPGGFTPQDPSYAWRFNQGLVGQERTQAASGQTGSGAAEAAGIAYGQGMGSQEYANQFSRLSHLAGADIGSPAAAGQIIAGQQQQQQQGATAIGTAVGGAAGTAFGNWLNTPSTPGTSAASVGQVAAGNTSNFGQGSYSPSADWMP